ncbi:hypothetical protein BDP67DRAFT_494467 [Colletotrichum lupini]|nr:hypothetical protein BDP67DRAFT_494467 [Colletotrichum lupini]
MAPIMKFFYASLLAASTLTSAAFASPIDNTGVAIEARDVNFLAEGVEAPVSVEVTNSIAVRSVDEVDASLEKRFFTSPHIRRIFKVVAGNMISAASWAFNFWVEEDYTGKSTVWYSGVTGEGVSTPKIGVEGATFLSKTGTELDLEVPFIVKGFYAGKELIVHFVVRILSDAGETSVQYFYDRPTATIAGQNASVTSWDLLFTAASFQHVNLAKHGTSEAIQYYYLVGYVVHNEQFAKDATSHRKKYLAEQSPLPSLRATSYGLAYWRMVSI